jgi:hypothetical protein
MTQGASNRKGTHPHPQDYSAISNKNVVGDDTDLDDNNNHNNDGDDEEEALALAFESDDRYSKQPHDIRTSRLDARALFLRRLGFSSCMVTAMVLLVVVFGIIIANNDQVTPSSSGASISTCNSIPEPFQIHYEPKLPSWDVLPTADNRGQDWIFPALPSLPFDSKASSTEPFYGYFTQPHISNGRMVFVAEGDVYYCDLTSPPPISAVRLTVTVGNVRNPKLHPQIPHYLTYSATYDGIREIYLYDMRSHISKRLTYTDAMFGIDSISDWGEIVDENNAIDNKSASSIIYAKVSDRTSLRDVRLYQLVLNGTMALDEIPIPLAQAIDGVSYTFQNKRNNTCWYFVRHDQLSWTNRYVGGTVPNIWAYCNNRPRAVPLWKEYNGTSKSPQIVTLQGKPYLFFLSDRARSTASLKSNNAMPPPTSMELWATELPTEAQLYDRGGGNNSTWLAAAPITRVYCQFGGLPVREYSVDRSTGDVVLRIGADLYRVDKTDISRALTQSPSISSDDIFPQKIDLAVLSDFHELQERQIRVHIPRHLSTLDVFATSEDDDTSGTAVLMTIRGQVWVAPVIEEATTKPYQGAGQNLPLRRYRVLPGAMTAGAIRVLASRHIPLYSIDGDDDDDDCNDEMSTKRQFALVLATDPLSPTAEHAFYLVEIQANVLSQFEDLEHWPDPIVGGRLGGGATTANGGLGSVIHKSFVVSPCGRRFAWTDTDDRICVMTVPLYYNVTTKTTTTIPPNPFQCLPKTNNIGEPMIGTLADLVWSPGGRYLAVTHNARNQFNVISIVDCGSPVLRDENTGELEVMDIEISSVVQVTPSRFNSYEVAWGKSTLDIFLQKELKSKQDEYNFATTLYFISDRDVVSDVFSPWGRYVYHQTG